MAGVQALHYLLIRDFLEPFAKKFGATSSDWQLEVFNDLSHDGQQIRYAPSTARLKIAIVGKRFWCRATGDDRREDTLFVFELHRVTGAKSTEQLRTVEASWQLSRGERRMPQGQRITQVPCFDFPDPSPRRRPITLTSLAAAYAGSNRGRIGIHRRHRHNLGGGGIMIHRRPPRPLRAGSVVVVEDLVSRIRRQLHRSSCKQRSPLLAMRPCEHAPPPHGPWNDRRPGCAAGRPGSARPGRAPARRGAAPPALAGRDQVAARPAARVLATCWRQLGPVMSMRMACMARRSRIAAVSVASPR